MANTIPIAGWVRDEVRFELDRWTKIQDCLYGEKAVKLKTTTYLPMPNPEDLSTENKARYAAYLERAVFYNVTRRTLDGLVGQVFMRNPIVKLPPILEDLTSDVDGAGVSLDQQAKKCLSFTMSYGRSGLLADYPPVDTVTTVADQEEGNIRPTITLYSPWQIINWRTTVVGARKLLSLIVLQEVYTDEDDGFQAVLETRWRVLRLVPTPTGFVYTVEIWETENESPTQTWIPRNSSGQPFAEIPFIFVGSMNNDSELDPPPLIDLATLNIAHYRNSADYEESCYIVGQPTPYFAGLTKTWVDEVLKGKVMLGSRAAVPLPEGGSAGLLQVNTNTMPFEAMQHKERQMVALGAKLVEQRDVQRTFGEAQMEASAETSILATAAKNVATAYTEALEWCAEFAGISETAADTSVIFELNTDFPAARMSPEERAQLVAEWQAGGISYTEMRDHLRKAGVATEDDEKVKTENEKDSMRMSATAIGSNPGNSLTGGTNNNRKAPQQDGKTQ
jgi:hypothetical protein